MRYTYLTRTKSTRKLSEYIATSMTNFEVIIYDEQSGNTDIIFSEELTSQELIDLGELMDAYTNPNDYVVYQTYQVYTGEKIIAKSTWITSCTWLENGGDKTLKCVEIFGLCVPVEGTTGTYSCRVIDVTNNNVLCSATDFTNITEEQNSLPITNFSDHDAVIELQIKINSDAKHMILKTMTCKYV